MEARQVLKTFSSSADIVIVDLTWTFGLPYDFLLDFDLIITPSSDASLEVASTEIFVLEYVQKNLDRSRANNQSIIVVPSRIDPSHSETPQFSGLNFLTSCSIAPPIYRIPSIDRYYEEGFLCCSGDPVIAENFLNLGKFVNDKLETLSALVIPPQNFLSRPVATYRTNNISHQASIDQSKISLQTGSNQIPKKSEISKDKGFSFIPKFLRKDK